MKNMISTRQMTFSVAAFICASSLLTKGLYSYLKQDSWVGVLLGLAISLAVISIYSALAKRFPAKTLIEINDAVFGRVLGKIVSALYLFFLSTVTFLNIRDLGEFVSGAVLHHTPITIIFILFVSLCAWAVRKGVENQTRYSTVIVVLSIAAVVFNYLLLWGQIKPRNFFPMFTMPPVNYLIGAHLVAALPLCEVMVFFMLIPRMRRPEDFGKSLRGGVLLGTVMLLLIVVRDITALGDYSLVSTIPSFSVLRLIDVGEFLTRLEILYALLLITLLFFKTSIIYFASVSAAGQLLNFRSWHCLVSVFGVFFVVYAASSFQSSFEHMHWNNVAAPIYSSLFELALPLVTLLVAAVRRRFKPSR